MNRTWEDVKSFYTETFKVSPELVDLVAISDVLLMSVSGSSNTSISKFLDLDTQVVEEILDTALGFKGWENDLEFNPYQIYAFLKNIDSVTEPNFKRECLAILGLPNATVHLIFHLCKQYSDIEERIGEEWI